MSDEMNDYDYLSNRNRVLNKNTICADIIDKCNAYIAKSNNSLIQVDHIHGITMSLNYKRSLSSVVLYLNNQRLTEFIVVANNTAKQRYAYLQNTPPAPLCVTEWNALLVITTPHHLIKTIDELRIGLAFLLLNKTVS